VIRTAAATPWGGSRYIIDGLVFMVLAGGDWRLTKARDLQT